MIYTILFRARLDVQPTDRFHRKEYRHVGNDWYDLRRYGTLDALKQVLSGWCSTTMVGAYKDDRYQGEHWEYRVHPAPWHRD